MGNNCPRSSAEGRTSRPVNNKYLTSSERSQQLPRNLGIRTGPFPKDFYDLTEVANREVAQKRKSGSVEKATQRCH